MNKREIKKNEADDEFLKMKLKESNNALKASQKTNWTSRNEEKTTNLE